MSTYGSATADAGTVAIRVQVVDVEPVALDLVVPTYIAASDLTQRIARDANLGAYWPDGSRRSFWLRARGRLLADDERLDALGVISGELLHLLPQPPEGIGVVERPPEYPLRKGYPAAGVLEIANALVRMLAFVILWAFALSVVQSVWLGVFPSIGLALLCTSFARHIWGGAGSSVKIPVTAFAIYLPLLVFAVLPGVVIFHAEISSVVLVILPAFVMGALGVVMGWLAWYGAVEPLPDQVAQEKKVADVTATQIAQCGLCGGAVDLADADLRADCSFGCGKVFHTGCYRARVSVHRGDDCAICGQAPAA